jgi:hypothetical protein
MKIARLVLSNKGIIVATIFLLMLAAVIAMTGIVIEAGGYMAGQPLVPVDGGIVSYVMTGVMGDVPSTAGTLQSIGLFLAYVVAPFVASIMFALRSVVKVEQSDFDDAYA